MKKILIAEDDVFLNKIYKVKLRSKNYDTVHVYKGDEIIPEVESSKPDLIILDVIMPGKDGFAVLKELKERQDTKNIPVIVLTNLSEESDKAILLAMGAKRFMTKVNVSFSEVIEAISQELG